MHNRRNAVRMELNKSAMLSAADGLINRSCQLRNISSRGARIVLADHADLPDDIVLHLAQDGVSWPCRIVRRQAGEIGVVFT